jgi:hypothetical protein
MSCMHASFLDGGDAAWGVRLRRATRDSKDGVETVVAQAVWEEITGSLGRNDNEGG